MQVDLLIGLSAVLDGEAALARAQEAGFALIGGQRPHENIRIVLYSIVGYYIVMHSRVWNNIV